MADQAKGKEDKEDSEDYSEVIEVLKHISAIKNISSTLASLTNSSNAAATGKTSYSPRFDPFSGTMDLDSPLCPPRKEPYLGPAINSATSNLDPPIDTGSKEGFKDTISSSIVKELSKKAYTIPEDKNPDISNAYSNSDQAVLLMLLRDSLSSSPRAAISWIYIPSKAFKLLVRQYSRPIESKKKDVYNEFHALTFSTYKKGLSAFNAEFNGYFAKLTMAKIDIDPSLILNQNPAIEAYRAAHVANSSNSTPNSNSNPSKKGKNKKKGSYNLAIEEEEESDSSSDSSSSSDSNTQLAQLLALKGYKKRKDFEGKGLKTFSNNKAKYKDNQPKRRPRDPALYNNLDLDLEGAVSPDPSNLNTEKPISIEIGPSKLEPYESSSDSKLDKPLPDKPINPVIVKSTRPTISIRKPELPEAFPQTIEPIFAPKPKEVIAPNQPITKKPLDNSNLISEGDKMQLNYYKLLAKTSSYILSFIYKARKRVMSKDKLGVFKFLPRSLLPSNRKLITCRNVLKVKKDAKNRPIKYKSRLVARGFIQVEGLDYTVTYASTSIPPTWRILLAIDDCLFIGPDIGYITDLQKRLDKVYAIEDLGPAAYFLGGKPHDFSLANLGPELSNSSNITTKLSRDFHSKEGPRPLTTTSTTIVDSRNGKGSSRTSIINSSLVPIGFSESGFAGDKATSKSTYSYLYKLAGRPISWKTKRATTIALSTLEAKTDGLIEAIREVQWILGLFSKLHRPIDYPITLYRDNQGSITVANDLALHARTKC
ncbi:hypothetical protein P8C59_002722 [Phyllachora maydis]|uniref:Reverse transcriptase Ty1/copia-type domain-containing protein n=1 Tax=Phyllachora maydis TaxID=1825666 RepID=A0AAD9HZZ2_9PEZI|nr:hypothetical protein P8C59_002722 [Phyllachora maydis]